MQTGFDLRYLASDSRSANATRYLRRDESTNARGQVLSSRFGSGDASQAFQWLVSEYDASTGWLLSRCSGLTICSGVAQSGAAGGYAIDANATIKSGTFGKKVRGKRGARIAQCLGAAANQSRFD